MKETLQQYASYNVWANQKIFDIARQLSEEQINQEIISSFPSVYKTLLHMLDAENIWWQRMKLEEHIERVSDTFTAPYAELEKRVLQQSKLWEDWVKNANEFQLQHVFAYQNSKREQFKQAMKEVLLHIFNHGTYHRGQLITMFRQLGVEKIPATDFIVYTRSKNNR
ncbi:MAG: DinB family protein [Ferruginibacter sp.]